MCVCVCAELKEASFSCFKVFFLLIPPCIVIFGHEHGRQGWRLTLFFCHNLLSDSLLSPVVCLELSGF